MAEVQDKKAAEKETAAKPGKENTYKCVTTCYWDNAYYKAGDLVKTDRSDLPKHFVKLN